MADSGGSPKTTTTTAIPATATKIKKPRKPRSQPKYQNKKQQLISILSAATSAAQNFLDQNDIHLLPSQSLTLESLLSSLPFPPSPSISTPPFFHRFLSSDPSDSDPRWSQLFRMSKPTFAHLISLLAPSLLSLPPSIPPDYAVAATIFRLAHAASYQSVAKRFGLDSSKAACLAFYSVCKAISEKLSNLVEFKKNLDQTVVGFKWISLPNCCGVLGFGEFGVDGDLLGKNGSLLVQALVDSEGRFLDISAGWPCTMKPASIFSQSKFFLGIQESKEFINGPFCELSDGNSIPRYILGHSCLPLLPWLLTPYIRPDEEDSFGSAEREFNSAHKRGMELVHTTFGRVKARWKLLERRWKEECVEFFPFVVVMGCLLHNFLIKHGEPASEECVKCSFKEEMQVFDGEVDRNGQRIRDALARHLSRASMRM